MKTILIQGFCLLSFLHVIQGFHSSAFRNEVLSSRGLFVTQAVDSESSGYVDDEKELAILENDLVFVEAIEERNKAQIESFVDEQDQWDSMTEWEQNLLLNKESHIKRIEELKKRLE